MGMRLCIPLLTAGIAFGGAAPAWSQSRLTNPIARVDLTGTAGWLSVDKSELQEYDNWFTSAAATGGVGWYWTDNLKTELEFTAGARIARDVYTYEQRGQLQVSRESQFHFGSRRLAVAQLYQFYRNATFHPYVGAGIDVNWESIEREDRPEQIFDPVLRQPVLGAPAERHPKRTDVHTRPFAVLGFKAYMTPRTFFRTDLKFVVDSGVEEVLTRFGFGVDF